MSVDGFIARSDGRVDWLDRVQLAGEDYGYAAFLNVVDALIVGRTTWEAARTFHPCPYVDKRVLVASHFGIHSQYGEERWSGDPHPLLERLHDEGVGRVYVDGGQVIRQFLAAGLIDDLTLSTIPVILGSGIPLFCALPEVTLRLMDSRTFPSGLVQSRYVVLPDAPVRAPV